MLANIVAYLFLVMPIAVFAHSPFSECKFFFPPSFGHRSRIKVFFLSHLGNGELPMPTFISMPNCNDEYCFIGIGQPAEISVTFSTEEELTEARASMKWAFDDRLTLNYFLGSQADVCRGLAKGSCPIGANTSATYRTQVQFPSTTPANQRIVVELNVETPQDKIIICVGVNVLLR